MNREMFGTFNGNAVDVSERRAEASGGHHMRVAEPALTHLARVGHWNCFADLVFGAIE